MLVVAACLGLAGCSPAGTSASESMAAGGDGPFPVTVHMALGSATVPRRPQRVVTIGWGSQDAALALGVVPVGMEDFSGDCGCGNGLLPWDATKLAALHGKRPVLLNTVTAMPYERIAALHPDVILAVDSGVTAAQTVAFVRSVDTVGTGSVR